MIVSEILKKQISISYPNTYKKLNELIGVQIENCGRLYVTQKLDIHIVFENPIHSDERIVHLFFDTRIVSDFMNIYISKRKFQAYRKTYGTKTITDLELAMEYFSVFKSIHDSLKEFLSSKGAY
jgi:hypothetical protein